jgi:hypothetical protein
MVKAKSGCPDCRERLEEAPKGVVSLGNSTLFMIESSMNLQQVRKALSAELNSLDAQRTRIQAAIDALGGAAKLGRPPGTGRPKMSKAARAKIAKAQRERWAKWKAAKK